MENYTVRLATIEDLPWIRALWRDMVTEAPPPYPANIVGSIDAFTRSVALALTAEPAAAWIFLAHLPGSETPDAFFTYEIQQRAIGEPTTMAFVHAVYTRPAARGRGLATTLLVLAGEHMALQHLDYFELTTEPGRTTWEPLAIVPYETRHVGRVADSLALVRRRRETQGNGLDPAPPPTRPAED